MKKLLLFVFTAAMLFSLAVTANAQEDDMYYNEYDNYDEFEQDYYDSVVFPKDDETVMSFKISPIPPISGIAVGTAVVFVLHRRHTSFARRAHDPYPERIKSVHTVTTTNTL
ncbi:MAG: hypothetical protein IIW48_00305 [Clostridia bacterium]|nr:hypothetical protein [Clostridia bacterium]